MTQLQFSVMDIENQYWQRLSKLFAVKRIVVSLWNWEGSPQNTKVWAAEESDSGCKTCAPHTDRSHENILCYNVHL